MNHIRFPKEDHLPDWARRDNKVTKRDRAKQMLIRLRSFKNIWHDVFSLVHETTPKFSSTGYAKDKFLRAIIRYAVKVNVRCGGKTPHSSYLGAWLKGVFTFLQSGEGSHSCIAEDSGLLECYAVSIGSYRRFGVLNCITAKRKVIWSYKTFVNTNRHGITYQKTRKFIYIFAGNNYFTYRFTRWSRSAWYFESETMLLEIIHRGMYETLTQS